MARSSISPTMGIKPIRRSMSMTASDTTAIMRAIMKLDISSLIPIVVAWEILVVPEYQYVEVCDGERCR